MLSQMPATSSSLKVAFFPTHTSSSTIRCGEETLLHTYRRKLKWEDVKWEDASQNGKMQVETGQNRKMQVETGRCKWKLVDASQNRKTQVKIGRREWKREDESGNWKMRGETGRRESKRENTANTSMLQS